ncbi:MAG: heparan-alpha-glucosaminide N-acetyltransferase domain-containing protein [bacterium]
MVGSTSRDSTPIRLQSLDIIRGAVVVLMAVDHVRHYSGHPPGGPTADIFFTRWITHFAAPVFCFFAGAGAFLLGRKLDDLRALSRYLLERGALLLLLELTVIREFWTFNFDYAHYIQGNVIWVLGWSMIVLAGLVRVLSPKAVGIFGLVVIFAQQLLKLPQALLSESAFNATKWFWQFMYLGGKIELGHNGLSFAVIYSLVPWIGVMAAGYGFGTFFLRGATERRRLFLRIGLSATAAFVVVAGAIVLLHTPQPNDPPALFQFLGQQKYPASQLYLMMTLGPAIALLPFAERAHGRLASWLATFGRVPMFFYLIHIPLIHSLAILVSLIRTGSVTPWLFGNHPWAPPPQPPGYMWSFGLLYLVFVIAIVLLYFPCRWYADVKARHKDSWLRFV